MVFFGSFTERDMQMFAGRDPSTDLDAWKYGMDTIEEYFGADGDFWTEPITMEGEFLSDNVSVSVSGEAGDSSIGIDTGIEGDTGGNIGGDIESAIETGIGSGIESGLDFGIGINSGMGLSSDDSIMDAGISKFLRGPPSTAGGPANPFVDIGKGFTRKYISTVDKSAPIRQYVSTLPPDFDPVAPPRNPAPLQFTAPRARAPAGGSRKGAEKKIREM